MKQKRLTNNRKKKQTWTWLITFLFLLPIIFADIVDNQQMVTVFTSGGIYSENSSISADNSIGQLTIGKQRMGRLSIFEGIFHIISQGIIPTIFWEVASVIPLLGSGVMLFWYSRLDYERSNYIKLFLFFVGLIMIFNSFVYYYFLNASEQNFIEGIIQLNIVLLIILVLYVVIKFVIEVVNTFRSGKKDELSI